MHVACVSAGFGKCEVADLRVAVWVPAGGLTVGHSQNGLYTIPDRDNPNHLMTPYPMATNEGPPTWGNP